MRGRREWVASIFAMGGKVGYQGLSGHSPDPCDRQLIGHCGRWRFNPAAAAMGWSPDIGQEISLSGSFLIS